MDTASSESLVRTIRQLGEQQAWNHCIEFADGVLTTDPRQHSQGKNLVKWDRMRAFIKELKLNGKRVIDLGANDGFFSLKMAEEGAAVTAVEASPHRIEKERFVFAQKNVADKVTIVNTNIFDLVPAKLGKFDLVLCMGFLHRVPDPFTVLKIVSELGDNVVLEFKALQEYAFDRPYLYFDGRMSDPNDIYSTCYVIPTTAAIIKMGQKLGFRYFRLMGDARSRRVMLVLMKEAIPGVQAESELRPPGTLPMLKKYTKRFIADVWNTILHR
jgi:SAM-dependent methyltransferase